MRIPLLLLALSSPALAALQPMEEAPVASESDIRCQHNADNSVDCITRQQYTILKPVGVDRLTRLDFAFGGSATQDILSADVRQPDGRVQALGKEQMGIKDIPDPLYNLSREKVLWLAFPQLVVGSTLRIQLRSHQQDAPLSQGFEYALEWPSRNERLDRYRFEMRSEQALHWRGEQLEDFTIQASPDRRQVVITLNQPYYRNENLASIASVPLSGANRHWPRLQIASSDQAQLLVGPYAARYNSLLAAPLPPQAAAAVAAQQGKPAAAQVAAFMQHINSHYRYLSDDRPLDRGLVPFTLEEIERHGYGDCKDLAMLLTAMLRQAGIAAEPALTWRGTFAPAMLLPGLSNFNHMIVRAEVDGQVLWLDATNPYFDPSRIPEDLQERTAFRIARDGRILPADITAERPAVDRTRQEISLHSDGSGQTHSHREVSGPAMANIARNDRDFGPSVYDGGLCSQSQRCKVERAATAYLQPRQYTVVSQRDEARMARKISGLYLYEPYLDSEWEHYETYRQNGNLFDVYLGDAENKEFDLLLKGARSLQSGFHCQARSRWFDLELKQSTATAGVQLHYQLQRKVRWLSHEDIVSPAFIAFGQAARACVEQAPQLLKLPAPIPATAQAR